MTDKEQFGAKTFKKFEKNFEVPILSKIDFLWHFCPEMYRKLIFPVYRFYTLRISQKAY